MSVNKEAAKPLLVTILSYSCCICTHKTGTISAPLVELGQCNKIYKRLETVTENPAVIIARICHVLSYSHDNEFRSVF